MTGGDGMQTVEGKSVLNQVVFGKLKFCRLAPKEPKPRPALCTEEEAERFFRAQKQSVLELNELHDRTCRQIGEETASIFAIHAMLLEDEDFIGTVCRMIREKGTCAEYAVWETGRQLASTFSTMDNLYMQARAVDFRDITYRIVWRLRGGAAAGSASGRPGDSGLGRVSSQRGDRAGPEPPGGHPGPGGKCGQPHRPAAAGVPDSRHGGGGSGRTVGRTHGAAGRNPSPALSGPGFGDPPPSASGEKPGPCRMRVTGGAAPGGIGTGAPASAGAPVLCGASVGVRRVRRPHGLNRARQRQMEGSAVKEPADLPAAGGAGDLIMFPGQTVPEHLADLLVVLHRRNLVIWASLRLSPAGAAGCA